MRKHARNAFTLIEILIVVVIMAVLAATIIPQFSSSVDDSKANQQSFNLHSLRTQIELYRLQHNGVFPAITNNLEQLTSRTLVTGVVDSSGTLGPYIFEAIPDNPITQSNVVTATTTGKNYGGGGWLYNASTGEIWADQLTNEDD